MIDWKQIMEGLKTKSLPAKSELNIMNERRQDRIRGVSLNKFKYEWKKKSRIVVPLQIGVPFNPATGVPDDDFNTLSKWRPAVSASTAAKIIKAFCIENENAKQVFMTRAGVTEWDCSNPDELTDEDFKVLIRYRVPLVLTADTISVNDEVITGRSFPIKYSIDIKYDLDTGQIIGEKPLIAKIGDFMTSVIFNEIRELEDAIKLKDPKLYKGGNPNIAPASIPEANEKQFKEWRSSIFQGAIISSPNPSNFLIGFEFPLSTSVAMTTGKEPLPEYLQIAHEDLKLREVYFDASKKYRDFLAEHIGNPDLDHFWNLIEFDLCDSTSSEPSSNDEKARASADLKPSVPTHGFYDIDKNGARYPWVVSLMDALADYRDSDENFERKMAAFLATRIKAADDSLISAVCDRLEEKVPINSHYIRKETLAAHKEAMTAIYDEEYLAIVMEDPDALEGAAEAGAAEIADAASILADLKEESSDGIPTVEELTLD